MDEKKINDIVESIEKCVYTECHGCKYRKCNNCDMQVVNDLKELIGQQQAEIEGLKKRGKKIIDGLYETIDKKQEEIERLTENLKNVVKISNENREKFITAYNDYLNAESREHALQKKVDELTEKNKNLKYSLDTANGYIKKLAESCETNCDKFNGITVQQAVKDTVKEILQMVDSHLQQQDQWIINKTMGGSVYKLAIEEIKLLIKKRYGVEME